MKIQLVIILPFLLQCGPNKEASVESPTLGKHIDASGSRPDAEVIEDSGTPLQTWQAVVLPNDCHHPLSDLAEVQTYAEHAKDDFIRGTGTCGVYKVVKEGGNYSYELYFYGGEGALVAHVSMTDDIDLLCKGWTYWGDVPTSCDLVIKPNPSVLLDLY